MSFGAEWIVNHYGTLSSTMDRAALLAQSGARDRTAVVCTEQTAGRGRGGRPWHSPPGAAIYATLIVRPAIAPDRLPALSLLTGVAVAETIEAVTDTPVRLKWPNDAWLGDDPTHQKVAGILLTSRLTGTSIDYALVGIGINVATPLDALPIGATSIQAATETNVVRNLGNCRSLAATQSPTVPPLPSQWERLPPPVEGGQGGSRSEGEGQCGATQGTPEIRASPEKIFDTLLQHFDANYSHVLATGGRPSLDAWRARAALLHEEVVVEVESGAMRGGFIGIDDDGALLLREPNGHVRRIIAGDLVRGPRLDHFP